MHDIQIINTFLSEQASLRSPRTVRTRRVALESFQHHVGSLAGATRADVIAFIGGFEKQWTKCGFLSSLRVFYRWAVSEGLIERDPTVRVTVRPPEPSPRPMPDSLLAEMLSDATDKVRRALVLARFAGLRIHEIAKCHASDLVGGVLWVDGKGGKRVGLPAHPRVAEEFRGIDGWLFPGLKGGHCTAESLGVVVNRHIRSHASGWSVHKLRHRFITEVHKAEHDLELTMRLARHSSPATSLHYVGIEDDRAAAVVAGMRLAS